MPLPPTPPIKSMIGQAPTEPEVLDDFECHLAVLINRLSLEGDSGTPDFVIAQYLRRCLESYNAAMRARNSWYSAFADQMNQGPAAVGEGESPA